MVRMPVCHNVCDGKGSGEEGGDDDSSAVDRRAVLLSVPSIRTRRDDAVSLTWPREERHTAHCQQ